MSTVNPNESTAAGAAGVVDGVARQAAGDVRRMLNERANAIAYGNTDRVKKIERDLKEMGFTGDLTASPVDKDQLPVGRSSGKPDVTSPVVTTTATNSPAVTRTTAAAPSTTTASKATAGS